MHAAAKMDDSTHLEACATKLSDLAKAFADGCSTAPAEMAAARHSLLSHGSELQMSLMQPADFLRHLVIQIQVLACLQWLGDLQVLACIPLSSSVQVQDLAEVANVPEADLRRIVRLMATVGFLHEPQLNHVSHTALSAGFVTRPSHLDAALFLAETAAPMALQMGSGSKQDSRSDSPRDSVCSLLSPSAQSFQTDYERCPRLQRQLPAFSRHLLNAIDDGATTALLGRLDWQSLGSARVVDATAESTSFVASLSELYPSLSFVVQMNEAAHTSNGQYADHESCSRISVQHRSIGEPQTVKDGAVYLVRLTSSTLAARFAQIRSRALAELHAHVRILRANPAANLILQLGVVPEGFSADPCVKETACVLDMFMLQFGSDRSMELSQVLELVHSVRDSSNDGLVVVNQLCSPDNASVVLRIKYQAAWERAC